MIGSTLCSSLQLSLQSIVILLTELKLLVKMVDIAELCKSEFWNKKLERPVETCDADKSGTLTRSDFQLVVSRYEKLTPTTKKRLKLCLK